MRILQNKLAFTLSEVLITLAIIGIVAALTIPTLVSNYQKTQYVTGLKKFYTTFNQALSIMTNDYDCQNDLKCTKLFSSGTNSKTFGDELVKYIKAGKNCGDSSDQDCWANATLLNYDGSPSYAYNFNMDGSVYYKFITADGMSVVVYNYATNNTNDCSQNYTNNGNGTAIGYLKQTCGTIIVDVNGPKPPNYCGRDTFFFYISNGKGALLYPQGGRDNGEIWWADVPDRIVGGKSCVPDSPRGDNCAGRVMEEGWQMNY